MNLYLISQDSNSGYDTFDSAVVAAMTEDAARDIPPISIWGLLATPSIAWDEFGKPTDGNMTNWALCRDDVSVRFLGVAVEGTQVGVICASFNAG